MRLEGALVSRSGRGSTEMSVMLISSPSCEPRGAPPASPKPWPIPGAKSSMMPGWYLCRRKALALPQAACSLWQTDRQTDSTELFSPAGTQGLILSLGGQSPDGPVSLSPGGCRLPLPAADPASPRLLSVLPEEAAHSFRHLVLTSAREESAVTSWVSWRGVD